MASSTGKLELEYAGAEQSELEIVVGLLKRATRVVFEEVVEDEGAAAVLEAFEDGWQSEVGPGMPAGDYLDGLDQIAGLREAAAKLAGAPSAGEMASAIEFVLEGLHLCNRLNKNESRDGVRYQRG